MCDPRKGLAQRFDLVHVNGLEPETDVREQVKEHDHMTAPTAGLFISTIG